MMTQKQQQHLVSLVLVASLAARCWAEGETCELSGASFGPDSSFLVITRVQINGGADELQRHDQLAETTLSKMKESLPGLLHSTFDCNSESCVWSEGLSSDAAMAAKCADPAFVSYLSKAEVSGVEVYGSVGSETLELIAKTHGGVQVKHFKTRLGYNRLGRWPVSNRVVESSFGRKTPFILLARSKIKEGKVEEYLKSAQKADNGVQATEPRMLHHTLDADPECDRCFVWSEIYANDDGFLFHISNPPLLKHFEEFAEVGESFSVELYGTLDADTIAKAAELNLPTTYRPTKFGFSRIDSWDPAWKAIPSDQ